MAGSYRYINYSLRPAKAVERKMFCDIFRRLYPFGKIESYRYVGFGSLYFSDFHLFHRALGLAEMLSIEKDSYAKEAFEFNCPYRCVRLDFRPSGEVLSELTWDSKTIIWLDYDGKLDAGVLSDVRSVCAKANSGSLLLVSVNVQTPPDADERTRQAFVAETGQDYSVDEYRLREFRTAVGGRLPQELTGRELRGKGWAAMSRQLITNAIQDELSARNSTKPLDHRIGFSQLVYFLYSDGARMMTIGGVLSENGDQEKLEACSFSDLSFVRSGDVPYEIRVPCLTLKEINSLNVQLPHVAPEQLNLPGVAPSDIQRYAEIYRYFPTFAEAVFV